MTDDPGLLLFRLDSALTATDGVADNPHIEAIDAGEAVTDARETLREVRDDLADANPEAKL